jgi:hypothetical protein
LTQVATHDNAAQTHVACWLQKDVSAEVVR